MRFHSSLITVAVFALASCAQGGTLSPEDVLRKSSVANSGLRSARVQVNASVSTKGNDANVIDGKLTITGNMQEGGQQLDVVFASDGTMGQAPQSITWKTSGRLITLSQSETYIQVHALEIEPAIPFFNIDALKNSLQTWLKLPSPSTTSSAVTPDPHFLRLQSEVVRVTKNHGIVSMNGRNTYHYSVSIDRDRLAAYLINTSKPDALQTSEQLLKQLEQYEATGEMWIDDATFLLSKVSWTIKDAEHPDSIASLTISIEDVGVPVTITAPASAQPFSLTPTSNSYD